MEDLSEAGRHCTDYNTLQDTSSQYLPFLQFPEPAALQYGEPDSRESSLSLLLQPQSSLSTDCSLAAQPYPAQPPTDCCRPPPRHRWGHLIDVC